MNIADNNAGGDNQRQFTRVPFVLDAVISQDIISWDTHVIDISMKGILINSPNALELSKLSPTSACISFSNGQKLNVFVELAHKNDSFYGFQFLDMDAEGMGHLHSLILDNLEDDSACERELMALFSYHQ